MDELWYENSSGRNLSEGNIVIEEILYKTLVCYGTSSFSET